jgi:hypothetical protein
MNKMFATKFGKGGTPTKHQILRQLSAYKLV